MGTQKIRRYFYLDPDDPTHKRIYQWLEMQNNMSRAIINALEKNLDEDKLIKAIENIIHNKLQNITLAQQKTGKPDKEDHTWLDDLSI